MNEEIRPVIVDGFEIPGYFVSNTGKVWTAFKPRRIGNRLHGGYISEHRVEMTPTPKYNTDGSIACLYVKLSHQNGLFEYDYASDKRSKTTSRRKVFVHQLVMNAFSPIMENPPERLQPYWNDLPDDVKKWIAEAVYVNHKDHNPENNNLSNLEYCTPRENSRKATIHYGGNVVNKKSMTRGKKTKEVVITLMDFV